jgi:hypothetical protein
MEMNTSFGMRINGFYFAVEFEIANPIHSKFIWIVHIKLKFVLLTEELRSRSAFCSNTTVKTSQCQASWIYRRQPLLALQWYLFNIISQNFSDVEQQYDWQDLLGS